MDAVQALAEQAQPSPKPTAPRKNAGRQALPEHLARTVVMHEPESLQCKACDSDLVKVGQDISEQLQVEPALMAP
jgi:transposase